MSKLSKQTALRLPMDFIKRAEKLAGALGKDPFFGALPKVTTTLVLRQAILEGLQVLEAKHKKCRR